MIAGVKVKVGRGVSEETGVEEGMGVLEGRKVGDAVQVDSGVCVGKIGKGVEVGAACATSVGRTGVGGAQPIDTSIKARIRPKKDIREVVFINLLLKIGGAIATQSLQMGLHLILDFISKLTGTRPSCVAFEN